jgi:hypothetical protein
MCRGMQQQSLLSIPSTAKLAVREPPNLEIPERFVKSLLASLLLDGGEVSTLRSVLGLHGCKTLNPQ